MKGVVLITGASKGIGIEISKQLLALDYSVIGMGRTPIDASLNLKEIKASFPNNFAYQQIDLASESLDFSCLDSLSLSQFGKSLNDSQMCAVIHNAGKLDPIATISNSDIKDWKEVFHVNLFAGIQLAQYTIPFLRKSPKSKYIVISSGASTTSYPTWAPYCSSKAAVNMFIQTMALEEPLITCLAIKPGVVDTDMQKIIREQGRDVMPKKYFDKFIGLYEREQLVLPENTAKAIARIIQSEELHSFSGLLMTYDSSNHQFKRS